MKTNEQNIIEGIIAVLKERLHPSRIILFGSRARGGAGRYSDFDVAVEGVEMGIRAERMVKEALDERLGIFTVDLINLDTVDQEFRKQVCRNGKVIYEG